MMLASRAMGASALRDWRGSTPPVSAHDHHAMRAAVAAAVDGGERAVIFDRFRGVLEETVGEGTHFRIPWVQNPHIMDIRTRAKTISSVTGTKGATTSWCWGCEAGEPLGEPVGEARSLFGDAQISKW